MDNKQKSIFRLEVIACFEHECEEGGEQVIGKDAIVNILGHYSSLAKVQEAISANQQQEYYIGAAYAYMVKEIAVDGELGEVMWLSVRTYDAEGNLLDACLNDYNLCNQFKGRAAADIHFHVGDIVEVLEGRYILYAIVAALPPTPEDKLPVLDAMDDSYLVLPIGPKASYRNSEHALDSHLHVAPTHVFRLRDDLPQKYIAYLQNRLLVWQGRQEEADMSAICAIDGHDYLYNHASLPSKRICRRCHHKWVADYSGDIAHGDVWHEVYSFEGETRTDEELYYCWHH